MNSTDATVDPPSRSPPRPSSTSCPSRFVARLRAGIASLARLAGMEMDDFSRLPKPLLYSRLQEQHDLERLKRVENRGQKRRAVMLG